MSLPATRSLLLELREERGVVREGYGFLDEKRLLLVGEILRQLERFERLQRGFETGQREAAGLLRSATARHGLEGLQLQPAPAPLEGAVVSRQRRFFGVELVENDWRPDETWPQAARPALDDSEEVARCREAFADLLARATELAGVSGNLHRLLREYQRTERRARALEEVILPELDEQIGEVDARLEEMDQEDAVRVRLGR